MYLKKKWLSVLKVKNVLLLLFGVVNIALSIADLLSLTVYYWGDWDTVIHAKSTPESLTMFVIGIACLLVYHFSKNAIENAAFYSAYFEGDLNGVIDCADLPFVTGYSLPRVQLQLYFYRLFYMKNYKVNVVGQGYQIELYSKVCVCQCKNCGAAIEKKIYFTGECPFCHGSDLLAKVISQDSFYSIQNDVNLGICHPEYYLSPKLMLKKVLHLTVLIFVTCILVIDGFYILSLITNYNDPDFLRDELLSGRSYSSYELIKSHIMNQIIWSAFFLLIQVVFFIVAVDRIRAIIKAQHYADVFARSNTPYVNLSSLYQVAKDKSAKVLRHTRKAIRLRYLKNCDLEMQDGHLKIVLAKKIVKDTCPYCAAPIVGEVHENYSCSFCGRKLMDVVMKR